MTLDPLSAVLGFLAVAEAVLGVLVLFLGWRDLRAPEGEAAAARRPLLALAAAAAVATALLSLPVHALVLESWVPRWPGVLCAEGVRRIGTGTVGPSRLLPGIVHFLDATRFAVVLAAGAWWILRRLPGTRRVAIAAVALGAVAALDGAAAFAWVAIPKEEIRASAGCCTAPDLGARRSEGLVADGTPPAPEGLGAGYVAAAAALGAGAWFSRGRGGRIPLAALAAASLPLGAAFLAGVAAPAVLGLPHHRCSWCAFSGAPETLVGAALHVGAVLCSAWAILAGEGSRRLLAAAAFGFLASAAMAAVLLVLP